MVFANSQDIKFQKMDSEMVPTEEFSTLDINTKLVHALKQLQLGRIRSEIELHQKFHDMQAEFNEKLAEFDAKRAKIISGDIVPTEEECKYEFTDPEFPPPTESKEKGIPQFWPTIFHNLELISEMIQEHDEPIINHLVDVRYVILKEPRGFRIEFEFSDNEFFSNKILTKEYYYSDKVDPFEPLQHEGLIVNRTVGCKIDWKEDKNVTSKKVTKKLKHKSGNQVKTVEKTEKADSFFNFFDAPEGVTIDDVDEETREMLMADFDIGETLRHSVIPRAIIYYTGEGIDDDEDYDEDMDEEDFDEFDEDDEDEEDEEEEEADGDSPKKALTGGKSSKSAGSRGKGKGGKKEVPPECKQQ